MFLCYECLCLNNLLKWDFKELFGSYEHNLCIIHFYSALTKPVLIYKFDFTIQISVMATISNWIVLCSVQQMKFVYQIIQCFFTLLLLLAIFWSPNWKLRLTLPTIRVAIGLDLNILMTRKRQNNTTLNSAPQGKAINVPKKKPDTICMFLICFQT